MAAKNLRGQFGLVTM